MLVEREVERAEIAAALSRAVTGTAGVLVIDGEAGIGKTALLGAALADAAADGIAVLSARAGELERGYAYGVVRQVLVPSLAAMDPTARTSIVSGAAGLAGPVLGFPGAAPEEDAPARAPDQGAVLHGLYWLVANLAARQPTLLAVDDAQWSDVASMRFAAFLARRIEGLRLLVMLTVRSGDAGASSEDLAEVLSAPATRVLRPRPLSEPAVARLIPEYLGGPVEPGFTRNCFRVTGGLPFLVCELLESLSQEGAAPDAETAAMLDRHGPQTVSRSMMVRLTRLGDAAIRSARGVAVLGPQASTDLISAVAQVAPAAMVEALDVLIEAGILRPGTPIEFVHPLVRTSVYQDIPHYVRSAMHERAVAQLAVHDRDPEDLAAHVLAAESRESAAHATLLRHAADRAIARAAPQSAVIYLRRALAAAPPGQLRADVLYELGRCEQTVRDPGSIPHLQAALGAMTDRRDRGRVALTLAESLFYRFDLAGSRAVLDGALSELGEADRDLAAELLAMSAHAGYGHPVLHAEVRAELPRIRRLATDLGARGRELNIFLALVTSMGVDETAQTLELAERGLDGGRLLEVASADSTAMAVAVNALVFIDELERAEKVAAAMLADARRRGLVLGFVAGSAHRGLVGLRQGALVRAEAELRAALELAHQHELQFTTPFTLAYLGLTMLERGAGAEALQLIAQAPFPPGFDSTLAGATLRVTTGRLRLAVGDRSAGIVDLRGAGETLESLGAHNPNCQSWRPDLALAIASEHPEEATALIDEELAQARRSGSARATGIALRVSGSLTGGDKAIGLLRDAVATLAGSPARLELARALVDLGGALRRANARASAREPLRRGLELAARCGADPLVAHARQELLASGGRPRRTMVTGRDALTPSEQRIAELVARGDSNRVIAQALFITPKTVENHLGRVYKKLAINSRRQLAASLEATETPVQTSSLDEPIRRG